MDAGRVKERLKKLAGCLNLESDKLTSILARKTGCRSLQKRAWRTGASALWVVEVFTNAEDLGQRGDGRERASTRTYDTKIILITPDV